MKDRYFREKYFLVLVIVAIIGILCYNNYELYTKNISWEQQVALQKKQLKELRLDVKGLVQENVTLVSNLNKTRGALKDAQATLLETFNGGTWAMRKGEATAYSPFDNKDGNQASGDPNSTSIGLKPSRGVVAVNPRKIPYGSKVMLIYPDGKIHMAIAGDTGGFAKNGRYQVDVFKQTYAEAMQHGRQNVLILWQPPKGVKK